jgi:fructokinase
MSESTRRFDVICLGEALIDLLPSQAGPLATVPSFERHAGGAPANVAVGVARLGGRVAFVGTVGADPFGEFLQRFLADEGVDVTALTTKQNARTGVAFISLDASGHPRFLSAGSGGAELALTRADVQPAPIEHAWFLHLGTYVLSSPSVHEAALDAVARARAANVRVALDPNLRLHLWRDVAALRRVLAWLVPQSDVVKLSSDECEFITGHSDPADAARWLVDTGPALAIVTTGARGCVYARRGGEVGRVPSRFVQVVDSTGAGDGFMAGLLAGLARHRARGLEVEALDRIQLESRLTLASESGARVCEHVGAMSGLPRATELDGFSLD